jgi:hypothetical protein
MPGATCELMDSWPFEKIALQLGKCLFLSGKFRFVAKNLFFIKKRF